LMRHRICSTDTLDLGHAKRRNKNTNGKRNLRTVALRSTRHNKRQVSGSPRTGAETGALEAENGGFPAAVSPAPWQGLNT
jgi:hypothetical protein